MMNAQKPPVPAITRKYCVAPMMTHTDRHFRYFLRLISKHVMLYTEMLTAGALIHGDRDRFLRYNREEHPLALQLGGSDPEALGRCARMAEDSGYDEINLNVGCPSDRVQSGRFGACLMAQPALVADCVAAMLSAVTIPVTVKCRIGIDHQDSYADLLNFIRIVSAAGCRCFIIHARKAWLNGLSPRQNREIPALNYPLIYALKKDLPQLEIIINGGISTLEQCKKHLQQVDGVMLGRAVWHNPYLLAAVDEECRQEDRGTISRRAVLQQYMAYIESQLAQGISLTQLSRHILGLYQGQRGARGYRRILSEQACKPGAGIQVIRRALQQVETS